MKTFIKSIQIMVVMVILTGLSPGLWKARAADDLPPPAFTNDFGPFGLDVGLWAINDEVSFTNDFGAYTLELGRYEITDAVSFTNDFGSYALAIEQWGVNDSVSFTNDFGPYELDIGSWAIRATESYTNDFGGFVMDSGRWGVSDLVSFTNDFGVFGLDSIRLAIIQQPQSQTNFAGRSVALSITVTGTPPFAYQWFKAGISNQALVINGASNADYYLELFTVRDPGNYFCVVSNAFNCVTSVLANLTLAQPVSVLRLGNGSVSISPTNYDMGASVTLTATPGRWYRFVAWSDGVTNNPRTIAISSTNSFTALFTNTVPLERVLTKEWECVYGGTNQDYPVAMKATPDGGFIFAANSTSGISGNKGVANFGGCDVWVVKCNAAGAKEWEAELGGSGEDLAGSLCLLRDGGYAVAISSASAAGTGNKTSPAYGQSDFWIVKLNQNGGLVWQNTVGGLSNDTAQAIIEAADGGLMVVGNSASSLGGNKTSPNYGDTDVWLVKISSDGSLIWDKSFGTSSYEAGNDLLETEYGYLMAGCSGTNSMAAWMSDKNGNWVTNRAFISGAVGMRALTLAGDRYLLGGHNVGGVSPEDFQMILVDGRLATITNWHYGGTGMEAMWGNMVLMPDGTVVASGNSTSPPSGDKTSANYGDMDYWLYNVDVTGNKLWDVGFGGLGTDTATAIALTPDDKLLVMGGSASGMGGNKTWPNFGVSNAWLIKMAVSEQPVGTPQIYLNGQYANLTNYGFPATGAVQVVMTSSVVNSSIYYTVDGTDPRFLSTEYTAPIAVASNAIIRAITYDWNNSRYITNQTDAVRLEMVPVLYLTLVTNDTGTVAANPVALPFYLSNTVVTLMALNAPGWQFMQWGGDLTGSNFTQSVSITSNMTVQPTFGTPLTISSNLAGVGTVAVDPAYTNYANGLVPYGTVLHLMGVPESNKFFNYWSTTLGGTTVLITNNPIRYQVTNATPVFTGYFGELPSGRLALTVLVTGDGEVTRLPQNLFYTNGNQVTLLAATNFGWGFNGWSGDTNGAICNGTSLVVTMNWHRVITANFAPLSGPLITQILPPSQTNYVGGEATFMVSVTGTAPLYYQWFKNGLNILNATNSALSYQPLALQDAGNYSCLVSNAYGCATSQVAVLTVTNLPGTSPQITQQPQSATNFYGSNAMFSVSATGTAPLYYQWYKSVNSNLFAMISGATNAVYTLQPLAMGDAGNYEVIVSNAYGAITSDVAMLIVTQVVNLAPLVSLLAPTNNAFFIAGTNLMLTANASDTDGQAVQVQFFAGTNLLGVVTNPPFNPCSLVWSNVPQGNYTLVARAFDNHDASADSAGVNISVGQPPSPGAFWLESDSYTVGEGAGSVVIKVRKSGNLPAVINYATSDGLARSPGDYSPAAGQLNFVGGQTEATVTISILDDSQYEGDETFRFELSMPGNGALLTNPASATITILDNDSRTNSFTDMRPPDPAPIANGALQVFLVPPNIGAQWRFAWETAWRDNGSLVTSLPQGNYEIVFKPIASYVQPASTNVPVSTNGLVEMTYNYAYAGQSSLGTLTVSILPNLVASNANLTQQGQWRLLGQTNWLASGTTLSNLLAGVHTVEFKGISGWSTPAARQVQVLAGLENAIEASYFIAETFPGSPFEPNKLNYALIKDSYTYKNPYCFNGQLRTDAGVGSGFAVKERVVLTAAHVMFNDAEMTYVTGARWFFQRQAGEYEPVPLNPRGWYVFEGYAAQREADNNPGYSSPEAQNRDVAALYFLGPAARQGYGGYLVSDPASVEWLFRTDSKILVGYPVDGIAPSDAGKMHSTTPFNLSFQNLANRVFSSMDFRSYPGNSGGALYVLYTNNSYYYPAAVYLGGSGRSVVRSIDSEVADLIVRAEMSGNDDHNHSAGGVSVLMNSSGSGGFSSGSIKVKLGPASALAAGGGWRISPIYTKYSYYTNWTTNAYQISVQNGDFSIEFKPLNGYLSPTGRVVQTVNNQVSTLLANYQVLPPNMQLLSSSVTNLAIWGTAGTAYRIDYATNLNPSSPWFPYTNLILGAGTNAVKLPMPASNPSRLYRALWVP